MSLLDEPTVQARLAEAETMLEALRRQEVDAIIGSHEVLLVRLQEAKEALQDSDKLLRLALGQTPITLWQQDEQLRYRWIYNAQLGYEAEEVIGKRDVELLERREEAERLEALKRAVLETGTGCHEEVAISRGERVYYYNLMIEPVTDSNGEVKGVTCAAFDITERRLADAERERMLVELAELNDTLEAQVEQRTEEVRALSRSLAQAEQRERQRIAQVLHDDIQQMHAALQIQLALLRQSAQPELKAQLREIEQFVAEISEANRTLAVELNVPALQGEDLGETFTWLAQVMQERYQLRVQVEGDRPCYVKDSNIRGLLFRGVRELLFNVVKHAGIKEARLELWDHGEAVTVTVIDNGRGFEVDRVFPSTHEGLSFGLFSVRERTKLFGGQFEIESAPAAGTRATITLPKS